jgi:hypothetical protein
LDLLWVDEGFGDGEDLAFGVAFVVGEELWEGRGILFGFFGLRLCNGFVW